MLVDRWDSGEEGMEEGKARVEQEKLLCAERNEPISAGLSFKRLASAATKP
jgi:hypothetical protein